MKTFALVSLAVVLTTISAAHAQNIPNMPARNPWLADSAYPISHSNPGATEAVAHAPDPGAQAIGGGREDRAECLHLQSDREKRGW